MKWYSSTMEPGALDDKTKKLIALAVAYAIQEPYCIDSYASACTDAGFTPEEMAEAVNVAAVIRGGGDDRALGAGLQHASRARDEACSSSSAPGRSGLAAALGALERGFDVTVLETDDVGAALRRWGRRRASSPRSR